MGGVCDDHMETVNKSWDSYQSSFNISLYNGFDGHLPDLPRIWRFRAVVNCDMYTNKVTQCWAQLVLRLETTGPVGILSWYVTSHFSQLSLLPSMGWRTIRVKRQWQCSFAGKLNVGLASHWHVLPSLCPSKDSMAYNRETRSSLMTFCCLLPLLKWRVPRKFSKEKILQASFLHSECPS